MFTKDSRKSARILLVDDDEGDRMLVQKILKSHNPELQIECVEDGEEALAFLRRQTPFVDARRPDLVLLDLNLPKRDGFEVLRAIRGDSELENLPVVVLTTSMAPSDIRKCYQFKANAFVSKPGDLGLLRNCLVHIHDFWFRVASLP